MATYISNVMEFYNRAETISDPRVASWFLIPSPLPTYLGSFAYVLFSWRIGPYLMKNIEPFNLKYTLIVYNLLMMMLNFHIFKELCFGMIDAGYSYPCQDFPTSNDAKHIRIAAALWWYFASKLIEFLDTLFFVLRKKNGHVSFLHVYHHATMPMLWWIGVKWIPGGQSAYAAVLNAFIHIVMYFYYGVSAFGPSVQKYLWWKRYLTQMQITQFCIALSGSAYTLYIDCDFPRWTSWALIFYMISLMVLFANFYIKAYSNKGGEKRRAERIDKREVASVTDNAGNNKVSQRNGSTPYNLRSRSRKE